MTVFPTMYHPLAFSLARNTIIPLQSSVVPSLYVEESVANRFFISQLPEAIAFTLIPFIAHSLLRAFVACLRAPLAVVYVGIASGLRVMAIQGQVGRAAQWSLPEMYIIT